MAVKKATKKSSAADKCDMKHCSWKCSGSCNSGGCVYFLGFLGAAIYYLQTSVGFWAGVVAILKALVWPAFLIHQLLGL